ncbi:MAG: S8 family serine peptidase [Candidatus Thermoplasmatota archaeon]|nr:S8 family serine peptidase [Candidatus Thermoplasmatota archaeon]
MGMMLTPALFQSTEVRAERGLIEKALLEKLGSEGSMEVLIRFKENVQEQHLRSIRSAGLNIRYAFDFVDTVFAVGDSRAIMRASLIPGVLKIFYNHELEHHMDITTTVINATRTWHTMIQENTGEGAPVRINPAIDGTGVTVVVLDTGIDAGHTDLDYGSKTIINLKSNYDMVWTEVENGDTGSGHGTHCAGTVAGNGEGAGGSRAGVAPGANLIGLGTGDFFIANAVGGLEWVYEKSKPGQNPYNIRVVTNSWGSSHEYEPDNPVNEAIRKITYENNVVVTFSAGNEGSENHDGSEVTTNPYAIEPAAISIAAATHDGKGMASFSSRGIASDDFSWPDVNAPGVAIWSARARRTYIDAMTMDQGDAHYMAISGTSMSNPHVAGLVALLWQAAPSLRVSNISGDNSKGDASYFNNSYTKMHEAELILKLTAKYVEPSTPEIGIPTGNWTGLMGRRKDFAQGYGLVDAHKAVGLALALEELRRTNPETSVLDAYSLFSDDSILFNYTTTTLRTVKTNSLETSWRGEWTQVSNLAGVLVSENKRMVYVPPEAVKIYAEIEYYTLKRDDGVTMGQLSLVSDQGGSTSTTMEMDASGKSGWWTFEVEGTGFRVSPLDRLPRGPTDKYKEARIDYTVKLRMVMAEGNGTVMLNVTDYHAVVSQWEFADPEGQTNMTIGLETSVYDMKALYPEPAPPAPAPPPPPFPWDLVILALLGILAVIAAALYMRKREEGEETKGKSITSLLPRKKTQRTEGTMEIGVKEIPEEDDKLKG